MERDTRKESEIQLSMPSVQVPAIKFIQNGKLLYVQMNIKSYIVDSSSYIVDSSRKNISLHQGFLFVVEPKGLSLPSFRIETSNEVPLDFLFHIQLSEKSLPKIHLVGEFPELYHPHFRSGFVSWTPNWTNSEWIDYEEDYLEEDLGTYILRIARSLKYEEGYIKPDARQTGNRSALNLYQSNRAFPGFYPTDDIRLPTGKMFEIKRNEKKDLSNFLLPEDHNYDKKAQKKLVKFDIKEKKPPYSPTEKEKISLPLDQFFNSSFKDHQNFSHGHEFYLTNEAFRVIKQHIHWGINTKENIHEQGGILLGHAYRDPKSGVVYAIGEQAVSGDLAQGTPSYLDVGQEAWKEMLDKVDRLGTQLQIIGWYHTHPNNLEVFMSGTDRNTQSMFFGHDWQFAVVLNPHKQIWRVFYGKNSYECRGYVLTQNALPPAND